MKLATWIGLATQLILLVVVFLASSPARADRAYWGCGFEPTTLRAGPLICHQTVTCRAKSLSCEDADKLRFVADAFADHIAVPGRGQYVLGLSNRGVHPLFWLRDFNGTPISLTPGAAIRFCSQSVTNVREWFDMVAPDVRFRFAGKHLSHVVVRGCDGHDVSFRVG